ncbi:MAG: trypsin-like peptidase domain-containing protein [Flavobacteriales bacterium]|jgi:S1-C subfamily serine protease|nr:trypsin-like peptidase domain-containing protein [Flavobacteriales bacterium]
MNPRLFLLALPLLSAHAAIAQFGYIVNGSPDSAQVLFNGKPKCQVPCRARFSWSEAVDKRIAIEIIAPGYESWRDTMTRKPQSYDQSVTVHLKRTPITPALDSTTAIVGFDRVIVAPKSGDRIGTYTDKRGDSRPLLWDGTTQIGERTAERRFYEALDQAGVRIPGKQSDKLFAKPGEQRVQMPRFLVGAKLMEAKVNIAYEKNADAKLSGEQGRAEMRMEWQVLDRNSSKVVLTRTTTGFSRSRNRTIFGTDNQIDAFEDALWKFIRSSEFLDLLRNAGPDTGGGFAAADSSRAPTSITRAKNPAFKSLSEMIKHADRACVTIVTDDGHGSGVIIDPEGIALSAYHVVEGSKRIEAQFSDGLRQEARVLVHDMANDLVLLDITGSGFRALPLGQDEDNSMGDEVITIGTPADVQLGQSVSKGILSGKRKIDEKVYLQTDVAVSPGNSGGPLLNDKGEVIGIIQVKLVGEGLEGLGFAAPIERVKELLRIQVKD